jgi:glycosyltransferase involved in cell wall biosynthesis
MINKIKKLNKNHMLDLKKLNILYTNFHDSYGGGHDTYIKNIARSSDLNIYIACPPSSNLYTDLKHTDPNIYPNLRALYPIPFPSKLSELKSLWQSIHAIKKIIEEQKIDIVHTNGSADNRLLLYVKCLSNQKFKVVFTKHNSYPVKGIFSRWRLMHFNDAIIFVSKSIYQSLGFKTKSPKITVIHNGIDINRYIKLEKNKQNAYFTLVSNAGTADHKGWHYLFHAIKLLPIADQQKIKVLMIGHQRSEEDIHRLVDVLPSCVIEWTGFTKTPETYLMQGDIGFVLSDGCDTISFACREMMACGLPIMISNFGGLSENIDDRLNGWITPVGDVVAIKRLLQELLVMPEETLRAMSTHAREKAIHAFGLDYMINQTLQVYQKLSALK